MVNPGSINAYMGAGTDVFLMFCIDWILITIFVKYNIVVQRKIPLSQLFLYFETIPSG